jgi:hypothetical protein
MSKIITNRDELMATIDEYAVKLVDGGDFSFYIAAAGTVSSPLNMSGTSIFGFYFPEGFTSSDISFEASPDGDTFYAITDGYSGNPLAIKGEAMVAARVLPVDLVGWLYVRLVCATPQDEDVQVKAACGPLL